MKPKMFLLLSGILCAVGGRKYNNYGDDSNDDDFYRYGGSQSLVRRTFSNDVMKECHDYNEIARWINDQVMRTDKLTRFNEHLEELFDAFNGSVSIEHCCFYEKHTMGNIIENINRLADGNGTATIKPFGELGKDLDQILEIMKKFVHKGTTGCCEQLYESLKKLEENFLIQLDELKKSAEQNIGNQHKLKEDLKKKKTELQGEIKELKERLGNLEIQINGSRYPKWCTDLEKRINELNGKVQSTKKAEEEKANKLQKEINDLTEKQNEQNNSINAVRYTVESRTEKIKSTLNKCKKNFTINNRSEPECDLSDFEKRIKKLEDDIERLSNQLTTLVGSNKSHFLNDSILLYNEIKNDVTRIEKLVKKLTNGKKSYGVSGNSNYTTQYSTNAELEKRIQYLEKKVGDQKNLLGKSKDCCQNIDKLADNAKELRNHFRSMNQSCTEDIKKIETNMRDLQKRLNEALDKITKLKLIGYRDKTNTNKSQSDEIGMSHSVKELQNQLNETKKKLDQIKNHMNKTQTEIGQLVENCNKKFFDLNNSISNKVQANDELNEIVGKRINEIEVKFRRKMEKNLDDMVKRLENLEALYQTLSKDISKVLQLENRVDNFEKSITDAFSNFKNNKSEVTQCLAKCKNMNKIDDLIDRLEDAETAVKNCKTSTQPTAITKQSTSAAPGKPKKISSSAIGGSDFVSSKYGDHWLKK